MCFLRFPADTSSSSLPVIPDESVPRTRPVPAAGVARASCRTSATSGSLPRRWSGPSPVLLALARPVRLGCFRRGMGNARQFVAMPACNGYTLLLELHLYASTHFTRLFVL